MLTATEAGLQAIVNEYMTFAGVAWRGSRLVLRPGPFVRYGAISGENVSTSLLACQKEGDILDLALQQHRLIFKVPP